MDLVLKLRELRARAKLTQEDVAARSHIGVKTISSFESGARFGSMKLSQLEGILKVYGVTLTQFFSRSLDHDLAPWESPQNPIEDLARRLDSLPLQVRESIVERFSTMIDAVETMLPQRRRAASRGADATLH